jgi:hypothetical protein
MSNQPKDGGPAFPRPGFAYPNGNAEYPESGMSLRDWFAGQALPWCLAEFGGNAKGMTQPVEASYQIADAMLAERNKEAQR